MTFGRDPDLRARYSRDVSGLSAVPDAVVLPRDEQDVVAAVQQAYKSGVFALAVGGQTSTTGASVAVGGGLLIDMTRLRAEPQLDAESLRVIVSPGTRLGELRTLLAHSGYELPVDPTSENECTVGGAIATNASGPATYRHGSMVDWVVGLTMIDGTARRHHFEGRAVDKCAMGPVGLQDLTRLVVGSEGVFGVVTQATLRVRPLPTERVAVFVGFDTRAELIQAVCDLNAERGELPVRALEWLDGACCRLLSGDSPTIRLPAGEGGGLYIDLEQDQGTATDDGERLIGALDHVVQIAQRAGGDAQNALIFSDSKQRRAFAQARHRVPDTLNRRGRVLAERASGGKLSTDWSVPLHALKPLLAWTDEQLNKLDLAGAFTYGHIGNGHPHINLLCPSAPTKHAALAVLQRQLARVAEAGGAAVSEHGIGKLKRDLVSPYIDPASQAALIALKRHFDPAGIMAPGNLLEPLQQR